MIDMIPSSCQICACSQHGHILTLLNAAVSRVAVTRPFTVPLNKILIVGFIRDAIRKEDSTGVVRNRYCVAMAWLRKGKSGQFKTMMNGSWVCFAPTFTIRAIT